MSALGLGLSVAGQAAQLGYALVMIKPVNQFSNITLPDGSTKVPDIIANATIEEIHNDRLEITKHPVQQGAAISDHAFAHPSEVTLHLGWSNSFQGNSTIAEADVLAAWAATLGGSIGTGIATAGGLAQAGFNLITTHNKDSVRLAYEALQKIYYSLGMFTLYTHKRTYSNMMIKGLSTVTNKDSYNSMLIVVDCQQVLIVDTKVGTASPHIGSNVNYKSVFDNPTLQTNQATSTDLSNAITPKFEAAGI